MQTREYRTNLSIEDPLRLIGLLPISILVLLIPVLVSSGANKRLMHLEQTLLGKEISFIYKLMRWHLFHVTLFSFFSWVGLSQFLQRVGSY